MKATYFLGNKQFETREIPIPKIGDKDVLVKVAAALINNGTIKLDKIITHSFPVDKLEDAIFMQMSDESLKVIIE